MPLLPRLQLFEFIDQPWLSEPLRRGEVDYLRVVLDRLRPYDGVAPQLAELLLWDGVVSSLRTYAPADLKKLTTGLGGDGYRWSSGVHRVQGMVITYLIGQPGEPEVENTQTNL